MQALLEQVVAHGLCINCGGCVGLCPHICFVDGRVIRTDECSRDEGRCYEVCPRAVKGMKQSSADPLGPHRAVFRSRTCSPLVQDKAQCGGTVTALVLLAMDEGLINKAVLTSSEEDGHPRGRVIRDEQGVLGCSGSRFVAAGTLEAFNQAAKDADAECGIVGLPCQVQALRNLQVSASADSQHKAAVSFVFGLFCTWALDSRLFRKFLTQRNLTGAVRRYDVPPPPANVFQVMARGETLEFPLDEIRPLIMAGCGHCADMTAEGADLSVGALEGMPGWNTLIVRTQKGQDLVDLARQKSILELDSIPKESLEHLKAACTAKRKRGLARQEALHGKKDNEQDQH